MKKLKICLSSFLLILAFAVEAKSPPPGTGKADVPANIYIMLDTSGSMGSSVSSVGQMFYPRDVVIDSNDNVYVAEYHYHRIRKYDSVGNFIKTIGSSGNSDGRFYYPQKMDIDANDNLYIGDRRRIQKFNADGKWLKTFSGLANSTGVAVDSSGNVYANNTSTIKKWDSSGSLLATLSVSSAYGIDWYGGSVYVNDKSNRRVRIYSDDLSVSSLTTFNLRNNTAATDIEVNANGIYVINEGWPAKIQKYSLSGSYIKEVGGYPSFYYLYGITSDSSGNIYGTSFYQHRVSKYDSNLTFLNYAGPDPETRMTEVLKVIDKLTSTTELTDSAYFGLQDWASSAIQRVKIDKFGASKINLSVNRKITVNGVEKTNPDYKGNTWYNPSGGTNLDSAMIEADKYFNKTYPSGPMDPNASCQKNFLIVISDGQWHGSKAANIAANLLKTKGIATLVIGFHQGGSKANYISLAKAGGTYPDSPLFSNNWQQLYETMSEYIRQAISSRLTFSAPVVMPNISSGDHIFQSTFVFKDKHQWEGRLSKFKLNSDGLIGPLQWDAGAKLDAKAESSRKIWTVANTFGVNTSINNFTTSNATDLGRALSENSGTNPSNAETIKLIKFIRGIDAYDENSNLNTTEKRWKLGDIYHSRLTVVGKPNSKITTKSSKSNTEAYYRGLNGYDFFKKGSSCGVNCQQRKEVVYVGANDGMLHAFDSLTGEELWAFIPPTMLQDLDKMVSVKANKSNSIYGVDGSPKVKDIYYSGKWRTVLFSGMGMGGKGYFALDITNSASPAFLFAFENKSSLNMIYHWDSSGNRTDLGYAGLSSSPEYDYSKLGESLSTPVIVAMPVGKTTKWVAVFGAGYNAAINTKYGSSIYIVDLEDNGKVLRRIDLADGNSANNIVNSMPADLVSITPDTTSKASYRGSMIYGADLESKLWKLNLTDQGNLYEFTPTFNSEASLANDRLDFFQITPSIGTDDNLWHFYGTGNFRRIQTLDTNIDNRIYGIKDNKFPLYENVTGLTNVASSLLRDMTVAGVSCPTKTDMGWYVGMGENQRITGKLAVFNETVYATRYKPNAGAICSPGDAYLSEHAMACGNTKRTIKLGEGIATGAVVYNNKVYVGISGSGSGDIKDDKGNVVGKKVKNLIVITPKSGGTIGGGGIVQESWRELF